MKRLIACGLVLAMTTTGCARAMIDGIEMPTGDAAQVVNQWSALTRLPVGTTVVATLDSSAIIDGAVVVATETGLDLARPGGRTVLARESVLRVVRITSKAARGAEGGAALGFLLAALLTAVTKGRGWPALLLEPPVYAAVGATGGAFMQRQVLVYQRLPSPPK